MTTQRRDEPTARAPSRIAVFYSPAEVGYQDPLARVLDSHERTKAACVAAHC